MTVAEVEGGNPELSCLKHPGGSALPRTWVGRWLRAAMLDQRDERDRLVAHLNGGSSAGWNDDEPAVVQAAIDLVLKRYFGPGHPDPAVLEELLDLVTSALTADKRPQDAKNAEVVINFSLGKDSHGVDEVARIHRFRLRAIVVALASEKMDLGDADVSALLREAERLAFERGFQPTLAPRGRFAARHD